MSDISESCLSIFCIIYVYNVFFIYISAIKALCVSEFTCEMGVNFKNIYVSENTQCN